MYIDAMQQIYTNVTKVLVDSRQGSNLLYLPLDKIMQQANQGAAAEAPTPGAAAGTPAAPTTADTRGRDSSRTRDRDTR